MATPTEVNINLSGLERRIDAVAASTRRIEENISHRNIEFSLLNKNCCQYMANPDWSQSPSTTQNRFWGYYNDQPVPDTSPQGFLSKK